MLQGSHTPSTFTRSPISLDLSSTLFSMVRERFLHPHLSVLTLSYWLFLGIVIMLFFQCIAALLNPVHRKGQRIKWWLVSYTALMFSASTVLAAVNLNIQSRSLIDNREFPGVVGMVLQGPLGYLSSIDSQPPNLIPEFMFFLNGWLADGLLASRSF